MKNTKWLVFVEPRAELFDGGIAEDEVWCVEYSAVGAVGVFAEKMACCFAKF